MNPAMIALILSLIEEAIKVEPAVAAELQALFSNPSPSPADWQVLRAKVLGESFESLAPDAPTTDAAAAGGATT